MGDLPEDPRPDLELPPDGDLTTLEERRIIHACLEFGCTCENLKLSWSRCKDPDCDGEPGHLSILVIQHADECPITAMMAREQARKAEWALRIARAPWN